MLRDCEIQDTISLLLWWPPPVWFFLPNAEEPDNTCYSVHEEGQSELRAGAVQLQCSPHHQTLPFLPTWCASIRIIKHLATITKQLGDSKKMLGEYSMC